MANTVEDLLKQMFQENRINQQQAADQKLAMLKQLSTTSNQANSVPQIGMDGSVMSPDPVQRVREQNDAWRERFPNTPEAAARVGMTPETFLASQGNTATNQWAQLGGVLGVDPQKQMAANRGASAYRAAAEASRSGTNGRVVTDGRYDHLFDEEPKAPPTRPPGTSGLTSRGPSPLYPDGSPLRLPEVPSKPNAISVLNAQPVVPTPPPVERRDSFFTAPGSLPPDLSKVAPSNLNEFSPFGSSVLKAVNLPLNGLYGFAKFLAHMFTGQEPLPVNYSADPWSNLKAGMADSDRANQLTPQELIELYKEDGRRKASRL